MTTDDFAEELDIMQLSDSFFPSGLFTNSNGIESLFFEKKIQTVDQLVELNQVYIEQQIGPVDCVILANAYDACERQDFGKLQELDFLCTSMRTVKETRDASIRSGIQLAKCVKEFQDSKILNWYYDSINENKVSGVYPVSFAICCETLGITKQKSLLMLLYGFVVSNVGAALRLGMIQHFEGQKIVHQLKPIIIKSVNENIKKNSQEVWQFCPQLEVNQMKHEIMDSKMFVT